MSDNSDIFDSKNLDFGGGGGNEEDESKSNSRQQVVTNRNIYNYEDSSLLNIERLPNNSSLATRSKVGDKFQAAERFLDDYHTDVTIRDPFTKGFVKKHAYLYKDNIKLLEQRKIKLIDINYEHFTDWISYYQNRLSKVCEKYGFSAPFIELDKIDEYELNYLCIFMYSKYLLNCIEKDAVQEFQAVMKHAALSLFIEEVDSTFVIDPYAEKNPDPERSKMLGELHIGLINYPQEKDITDIRSNLQNKVIVIKGDLDSFDGQVRYEILTSQWECLACGMKTTTYGSNAPPKCFNDQCGNRKGFKDLEIYKGTEYVFMKLSQHVQAEENLIGTSDIIVKVEGPHLISNFWRRSKQSATLKVTGVVKVSKERLNKNNADERHHYIQALSIEVEGESTTVHYNEKLLDIIANKVKPQWINKHYEKLKRSICPHLHEMFYVKEAILLMLTGAVARLDSATKRRLRGDLVIMLLGDPALGKSEFGVFITKVNPYAIRTVGGSKTTTAASLTSSWEKINDVRVISKGVLPRCDLKGIAIIDELDKRNSEDMEVLAIPLDDNQIIPTHKAGYHHDIPARCPVLLIGNASKNNGRWDTTKNIAAQTNYGAWLVSRADLIFILTDDGDLKRKEQQVEHMAKSRQSMMSESDYNKIHKNRTVTDIQIEKIEKDLDHDNYDGVYSTEYLRHEFHYLKNTYKPYIVPGSSVEDLLKKEYLKFSQIQMVNNDDDSSGPYTQSIMDARAYNGLERIAMSIARAHRHHRVTMEDMQLAINLMMASVTTMLLKPRNDVDKLNDGNMSVHKQFLKLFKENNGFKKLSDAQQSAWNRAVRQEENKFRKQIEQWNTALDSFWDRCRDCKGTGQVTVESANGTTSEECYTCEGKGGERREFTMNDLSIETVDKKRIDRWNFNPWFQYYKDRKMIIPAKNKGVYKMGIDRKDPILMRDICNELAAVFALSELEKEKNKVEAANNNSGFSSI